jgi:hypothetical protein
LFNYGLTNPREPALFDTRSRSDAADPIVLLSPPSRQTVQRDCYCSHIAKASYCWHPFDLVVQSGILSDLGPIVLVDAVAEKLNAEQTLNRLRGRRIRAILSLVGSVCWGEDMAFLQQLKRCCDAPIIVSGDMARSHPRQTLATYSFIEGVLLSFVSRDLRRYLGNEPPPFSDLCLRSQPREPKSLNNGPAQKFQLPIPDWRLFSGLNYRLPFLRHLPFAAVTASFGCPFACHFCTAADFEFKLRDIDNVMTELRHLKKAGYRELHFKDLSFGCQPAHYRELLTRMGNEKLDLGFFCLARADHLQPGLTRMMRKAGCHLVHIGAESASAVTLRRIHKQVIPDQVREAVDNCKRSGLRTLASYILGLPGETYQDMLRTIEYAIELDTDFVSFNINTTRNGWPQEQTEPTCGVSNGESDLVNLAYRRFYFRPKYLAKQMRALTSPTQFRLSAASALHLMKKHLLK